jgi:hypothetical protein
MHATFTWQGQDMTPAAKKKRHCDAAGRSTAAAELSRASGQSTSAMQAGVLRQLGGASVRFIKSQQYLIAKPLRIALAGRSDLNNLPRDDLRQQIVPVHQLEGVAGGFERSHDWLDRFRVKNDFLDTIPSE